MKPGIDPDAPKAVFVKLLKMHDNSKATIVTQTMIIFVWPLRIESVPRYLTPDTEIIHNFIGLICIHNYGLELATLNASVQGSFARMW